jgi:alkanesulfonate monooxygenase SsuD/methylene tetrahydromethanopterin reductase-like flavin-dependent oxidoreductase (luciferase family)
VQQIIAEYDKGGGQAAARLVSDRMLRSLAICGSSEECRKSLARFTSAGITLPIIQLNPVGDSESSFRELLSIF